VLFNSSLDTQSESTVVARAQKPAMPVIGFLSGQSPAPWAPYVAAFRSGLAETGYVDEVIQ
jgi:putative ABC transport system substrate-binding protein